MDADNRNFNYTAVILAGGLGTRMRRTDIPKGLMPILEKPMIYYIIAELLKLNGASTSEESLEDPSRRSSISSAASAHTAGIITDKTKAASSSNGVNVLSRIIIVIGHKGEHIKDYIENENAFKNCGIAIDFAIQDKYLGTGDAAKQAAILIKNIGYNSGYNGNSREHGTSENNNILSSETETRRTCDISESADGISKNVLILPCDTPLITKNTLSKLIKFHDNFNDDLTVLSFETENPFSYGRILKDEKNFVKKIVEQQEIDAQMKSELCVDDINIKRTIDIDKKNKDINMEYLNLNDATNIKNNIKKINNTKYTNDANEIDDANNINNTNDATNIKNNIKKINNTKYTNDANEINDANNTNDTNNINNTFHTDEANGINNINKINNINDTYDSNYLNGIKEVNSGIYAVRLNHFINLIDLIDNANSKKEYYLTDIVSIFYDNSLKVRSFIGANGYEHDDNELMGVNSKIELVKCSGIMQKRIINNLIEKRDVNFFSTDNIYIGSEVQIGKAATLYPGCFLSGNSKIGENAVIECGAVIKDSVIGKNSVIRSYSVIENANVEDEASIGPFARLRPGTFIKSNAKIGNFVEVKNSIVGKNSKASHLSYIGDCEIGDGVNIGAGVITCNYDGFKKHKTIIKDNCFIGSDSQLIAPVTVEKDSYVASGTTVVKNVPEGSLAISRVEQINKEGWTLKRLKRIKNLTKAKAED